MVKIPVIIEVLVVPANIASVGIDGQRRVVVQVPELRAAEHEFWAGDVTEVPT